MNRIWAMLAGAGLAAGLLYLAAFGLVIWWVLQWTS